METSDPVVSIYIVVFPYDNFWLFLFSSLENQNPNRPLPNFALPNFVPQQSGTFGRLGIPHEDAPIRFNSFIRQLEDEHLSPLHHTTTETSESSELSKTFNFT